jgi:hypothetical protein
MSRRRLALGQCRVPGHRPDGKPTYCEFMAMLAVQPVSVERLASVVQVRRISSPMTLAVWARNN